MSIYARPKMLIVGSDSHTSTAGAFNAFAAGIDRTETAGLWKQGETWFRVPESVKIVLKRKVEQRSLCKRPCFMDYRNDRFQRCRLYVNRISW